MNLTLGVKSDPIEYRYSYEWLFSLMRRNGIHLLQLGSFFEMYHLDDDFFKELRDSAAQYNIRIKSCFTAHRELGGFFTGNPAWEKVARKNYERFIEVAAILGADYIGSNPGAVYRDRMDGKQRGIDCYLRHMKELTQYAFSLGLKGLTVEPMSCLAEPPSTLTEIRSMLDELKRWRQTKIDTVPVYLCGDISHGLVDADGQVISDNYSLFEMQIPDMIEFHFKNTDARYASTFGFSTDELNRGCIDPAQMKKLIELHDADWPAAEITGYLELPGPKLGRDYSDCLLEPQLTASLRTLRKYFGEKHYSSSAAGTVITCNPA